MIIEHAIKIGAHGKSVQFVAPCYCSPVAKVLVSSRVMLAEQVNKCLWVHIEVIVKVTVPSGGMEERERERERKVNTGLALQNIPTYLPVVHASLSCSVPVVKLSPTLATHHLPVIRCDINYSRMQPLWLQMPS